VNDRLPRAARTPRRPLVVPPTQPSGTRAPIGADAIRAAYSAHVGHEHAGDLGFRCPTCSRYLAALVEARAREWAERQP
jgi:hypothetical protein